MLNRKPPLRFTLGILLKILIIAVIMIAAWSCFLLISLVVWLATKAVSWALRQRRPRRYRGA